jgi:hypothetical protein
MFIATKAERSRSGRSETRQQSDSPLGRNGCAPPELRSKEKGDQAINISPGWGEVKNYLLKTLKEKS